MENNDKIIKIKNTKYTLKQSPHYEEQKDEIEILFFKFLNIKLNIN